MLQHSAFSGTRIKNVASPGSEVAGPMTELLTVMATPLWAYLALFGFLTVDAMIPVVPTQAIMITSGALTVYGDLSLPLVIAVGAVGMFTGDTVAFLLGRSTRRVGRSTRGAGRSTRGVD